MCRASPVTAAARDHLPLTSPIASTHVSPVTEEIEEVAAHHAGIRGQVQRRRLRAVELGQLGRQEADLQLAGHLLGLLAQRKLLADRRARREAQLQLRPFTTSAISARTSTSSSENSRGC